VDVDGAAIGRIIGKGGCIIKDLQARSGAFMVLTKGSTPGSDARLTIEGTEEQCDRGMNLVLEVLAQGNSLPMTGFPPRSFQHHHMPNIQPPPFSGENELLSQIIKKDLIVRHPRLFSDCEIFENHAQCRVSVLMENRIEVSGIYEDAIDSTIQRLSECDEANQLPTELESFQLTQKQLSNPVYQMFLHHRGMMNPYAAQYGYLPPGKGFHGRPVYGGRYPFGMNCVRNVIFNIPTKDGNRTPCQIIQSRVAPISQLEQVKKVLSENPLVKLIATAVLMLEIQKSLEAQDDGEEQFPQENEANMPNMDETNFEEPKAVDEIGDDDL